MYTRFTFTIGVALRFKYLWLPVIIISLYSAAIFSLYDDAGLGIAIPLSVPTVLGTAISILLGFRTSSAYSRWWEARKIWGAIINNSRTLVRQCIGFFRHNERINDIKAFAHMQIAWCYALNFSLRGLEMPSEVKKYLGEENSSKATRHDNVPNAILQLQEEKLAQVYDSNGIDSYQFVAIDKTLKDLCDDMGMGERIKKTVFPVQYGTFTRWAILIFMIILPFGMVGSVGVFSIPITTIVVFFFFLIEGIARYLQDPFENRPSDIPMTTICRTIEINLLEMVKEEEIPEKLLPDERGILM